MILAQAITITNLLLAHGNIESLTIERVLPRLKEALKQAQVEDDRFRVAVNDAEMDADDLARILKYEGAVRIVSYSTRNNLKGLLADVPGEQGPGDANKGKLKVVYVDKRFLIEDE